MQYESEIIKMVLELYHGPKGSCGVTTSGGSESICLAMYAYREFAKKSRGVTQPNIVAP